MSIEDDALNNSMHKQHTKNNFCKPFSRDSHLFELKAAENLYINLNGSAKHLLQLKQQAVGDDIATIYSISLRMFWLAT